MDISALKVSSVAIEQGEWVSDIPEAGDLRLKVRGMNNSAYRELQNKLVAAIPFKRRRKGLSADEQERIQAKCLIETVLLDWENLRSGDQTIPYSRDMAEKLITDPDYRAFRDAVLFAAVTVGEAQEADDSDLEKNSATSSSGG